MRDFRILLMVSDFDSRQASDPRKLSANRTWLMLYIHYVYFRINITRIESQDCKHNVILGRRDEKTELRLVQYQRDKGNVERDSRGLNTQTAYLLEKPFLGDRYHLLVPSSIVCRVVHMFC